MYFMDIIDVQYGYRPTVSIALVNISQSTHMVDKSLKRDAFVQANRLEPYESYDMMHIVSYAYHMLHMHYHYLFQCRQTMPSNLWAYFLEILLKMQKKLNKTKQKMI
jgi:hypothetical protein